MRAAIFLGLLAFFSCDSSQRPATEQLPEQQDRPQPDEPDFTLDTKAPFYLHLEGAVGSYPIAMELIHFPDRYVEVSGYEGYYQYEQYGQPISFYGADDEGGQVNLAESDFQGNPGGNFRGSIDAKGMFKGRWISEDQKRTLPFELKPVDDPSLPTFDVLLFSDSLLVETGDEEAPRVYVRQTWLFPKTSGEEDLTAFLREEIRKGMAGDSLSRLYQAPRAIFDADKQGYFREYADEIKSLLEYQRDNPGEESWMMNYEFSREMEVYYLNAKLLTLGFSDYYFTGGAHGNYATDVRGYDLEKRRLLSLRDLFKPGFEEPVGRILADKARQAYDLDPTQPLSDLFFEDEILPTENFGLTDKGIFFVYNPYEIAAYVFGQITLFVAFEELEEWMR